MAVTKLLIDNEAAARREKGKAIRERSLNSSRLSEASPRDRRDFVSGFTCVSVIFRKISKNSIKEFSLLRSVFRVERRS